MTIAAAIRETTGVTASAAAPDRIAYARDLWPRHHLAVRDGRIALHRPAAIAWPESTEQVAELVQWCSSRGVPLVPFGAGSGVCAGVLPSPETVVLDLKRMRSFEVDSEQGVIDVDAGALGIRLEEELAPIGFTIGHFPSSILCSTVGGWVAARGAGQCSGRYGKIEDMVVGLECIDGRGERAELSRRLTGPDLTPLWIGSEGVLGVITRARLRLHPQPAERGFIALRFRTMQAGQEALRLIYQAGLRPAVSRLYDPFDSMIARRGAKKHDRARGNKRGLARGGPLRALVPGLGAIALRTMLRVPGTLNAILDSLSREVFGGAMLVLMFEGGGEETRDGVAQARRIGLDLGAEDLGQGPARHWLAHRYSVSYRQAPMFMAGAFVDTMEVAAPWSKLDELHRAVRHALGRHVMVMAHMSHAYPDGCSIYFTFAGSGADDTACEEQYDRAWQAGLDAALGAGGTLSHHHGVGRSKAPKLARELGIGVELVNAARKALDPRAIFNPGNLDPRGDYREARARPLPAPPPSPLVDERDQLVHTQGSATLAAVEEALGQRRLSLGLAVGTNMAARVDDWLADGAPGAPNPWLDPVDHLLAGFSAELASGGALVIRPCPRRAAGPDLYALFHGMKGRIGRIHTAELRARDPHHPPPKRAVSFEVEPRIDATEQALIERLCAACKL